jgi:NodT family efflux transporter outer membrane factor (OMF) lipoprotein
MSAWCGWRAVVAAAAIALPIGGCMVGPNYKGPPAVTMPGAFKENEGWKVAQPRDDVLRGEWWKIFDDPQLDALEARVSISNQNLAQAEAAYRQASALVREARASLFPTVSVGFGYTRSEGGGGTASSNGTVSSGTFGSGAGTTASTTGTRSSTGSGSNFFQLGLDASWTPDLWGSIRRTIHSNQASAQASAGDVENARLSFQAALAEDYFQLRMLDGQKKFLEDTANGYEQFLQMTKNRYAAGVASQADVSQAEAQLKQTQAQAIDVGVQRAQTEHAIAVLIGEPASTFSLPPAPLTATPPSIPVGVPSELLERRPDIAGAERRVAAASDQIGVAVAAYYPTVTLSASTGFESSGISPLFSAASHFWALRPSVSETVFDGGRRGAQVDFARAGYDSAVATYRQTVLTAFQGVEDNLAALRILEEEAGVQGDTVQAARESVRITTNQYLAGTVPYLNVITTQATLLGNEITLINLQGRRMAAAVLLVQALGGGWDVADLPSAQAVSKPQTTPPAQ